MMRVLTIAFAAAVGANMTPAALFPVGTLQSYNSVNVDPLKIPLYFPTVFKEITRRLLCIRGQD